MTESQDTQDIQAQAREAILKRIVELAPETRDPEDIKEFAEAYALVVSVDEEEAAGSAYDR